MANTGGTSTLRATLQAFRPDMILIDRAGTEAEARDLLAGLPGAVLRSDCRIMDDLVYTRADGQIGYQPAYTIREPMPEVSTRGRGRPSTARAGFPVVGWRVAPEALAAFDALAITANGRRETRAETFERMVSSFVADGSAKRDQAVSQAIRLLESVFSG